MFLYSHDLDISERNLCLLKLWYIIQIVLVKLNVVGYNAFNNRIKTQSMKQN